MLTITHVTTPDIGSVLFGLAFDLLKNSGLILAVDQNQTHLTWLVPGIPPTPVLVATGTGLSIDAAGAKMTGGIINDFTLLDETNNTVRGTFTGFDRTSIELQTFVDVALAASNPPTR